MCWTIQLVTNLTQVYGQKAFLVTSEGSPVAAGNTSSSIPGLRIPIELNKAGGNLHSVCSDGKCLNFNIRTGKAEFTEGEPALFTIQGSKFLLRTLRFIGRCLSFRNGFSLDNCTSSHVLGLETATDATTGDAGSKHSLKESPDRTQRYNDLFYTDTFSYPSPPAARAGKRYSDRHVHKETPGQNDVFKFYYSRHPSDRPPEAELKLYLDPKFRMNKNH